jgi:hypothetical protein
MLSRAAAPTSSLSQLSTRSLRAKGAAARSLATVSDAPPVKHYGGLQDQDRIFTNLYGHHGADLKSAMKYGDWYRTKDMVLKGDDWVGCRTIQLMDREISIANAMDSSSQKSKHQVSVAVVALVSPQD